MVRTRTEMALNPDGKDTDRLGRAIVVMVAAAAILMSLFHLYRAQVGVLEAWRQRSFHVLFTLIVGCLVSLEKSRARRANMVVSALGLVATIAVTLYTVVDYRGIIVREGAPNLLDMFFGTVLMVLIVAATRRHVGKTIAGLATLFWAYGLFGWTLPGRLGSPQFTYTKIIDQMFNSTAGMFGVSTSVSAIDVIMFVIFGAFLDRSGGGEFFNDLAIRLTGRTRGGPAKAAVVASAFVGTIEGSAVANVVTTGTFTIPLMKRMGFSPTYAGAVEAAASTGGMIMPPVMGAAAFILAEMTKTSYTKVMLHALIPACLYFAGIFLTIDLRAEKEGLTPLGASIDRGRLSLERGATCLVPLASIVAALLIGFSPMKSALLGIVSLTMIWMIRRERRMTVVDLLAALESGATTMVPVGLACACAGIIVGFISLTGLGVKMSAMISILGVHRLVALVLAMVVCLILGMGMPVAAAYILASATVGGMLVRVGVPLIQAHLFILYFATISAITPPVALAAYAAAGIADAEPNAVGWQASKLALSGFIVPFMFIYGPSLLSIGAPARILQAAATSLLGVFCLSIVVEGWFRGPVPMLERILLLGSALLLIDTGLASDIVGLALIAALLGRRLLRKGASLERTPGTL